MRISVSTRDRINQHELVKEKGFTDETDEKADGMGGGYLVSLR